MQDEMNQPEQQDKRLLASSMLRVQRTPGRVVTKDSVTAFYTLAQVFERAATSVSIIAETAPDDPETWDGVLWYERFADQGEGSLAQALMCKIPAESATLNWLRQKY